MKFEIVGYQIIMRKQKPLAQGRYGTTYTVYTRKGKCPACKVSTGSRHSKGCEWQAEMRKKK